MLGQHVQSVRDCGSRGLVARRDEENEEGGQFLLGEFLSLDLSVHQRAGDVADGIVATVFTELFHDARQRDRSLELHEDWIVAFGDVFGVPH